MAIVRIKHLRKLKYCRDGTRAFFRRYGLDWHKLRRGELDSQELRNTNQPKAILLAELAERDMK